MSLRTCGTATAGWTCPCPRTRACSVSRQVPLSSSAPGPTAPQLSTSSPSPTSMMATRPCGTPRHPSSYPNSGHPSTTLLVLWMSPFISVHTPFGCHTGLRLQPAGFSFGPSVFLSFGGSWAPPCMVLRSYHKPGMERQTTKQEHVGLPDGVE